MTLWTALRNLFCFRAPDNARRRPCPRLSALALEPLEERQLLSATPVIGAVVAEVAGALYQRDHQITTADARVLFDIVDGRATVVLHGKDITVTPAAITPRGGTIPAGALKELDAIFASPTQWGITATTQRIADEVLRSVKAGDSDSVMRLAVNKDFPLPESWLQLQSWAGGSNLPSVV
jgi:hypothetical protein